MKNFRGHFNDHIVNYPEYLWIEHPEGEMATITVYKRWKPNIDLYKLFNYKIGSTNKWASKKWIEDNDGQMWTYKQLKYIEKKSTITSMNKQQLDNEMVLDGI